MRVKEKLNNMKMKYLGVKDKINAIALVTAGSVINMNATCCAAGINITPFINFIARGIIPLSIGITGGLKLLEGGREYSEASPEEKGKAIKSLAGGIVIIAIAALFAIKFPVAELNSFVNSLMTF